jgi:hypothetical protein
MERYYKSSNFCPRSKNKTAHFPMLVFYYALRLACAKQSARALTTEA